MKKRKAGLKKLGLRITTGLLPTPQALLKLFEFNSAQPELEVPEGTMRTTGNDNPPVSRVGRLSNQIAAKDGRGQKANLRKKVSSVGFTGNKASKKTKLKKKIIKWTPTKSW